MLQSQKLVTVTHDETGFSYGTFRTQGGAGKTSDNQVIRPGGMATGVAFAGPSEFDELTCERQLLHAKDSGLVQKAHGQHGDRFTIVVQPLDAKGRPGFHKPITHTGLLAGSTPADYDADGTDPDVLELTFTIDGVV